MAEFHADARLISEVVFYKLFMYNPISQRGNHVRLASYQSRKTLEIFVSSFSLIKQGSSLKMRLITLFPTLITWWIAFGPCSQVENDRTSSHWVGVWSPNLDSHFKNRSWKVKVSTWTKKYDNFCLPKFISFSENFLEAQHVK